MGPQRLCLDQPFVLKRSLHLHRFGPWDPTFRLSDDELVRAQNTPDGPGVLRIRQVDSQTFEVEAWGPGGPFLSAQAPDWLGVADAASTFAPQDRGVAQLAARLRGFRLPRTPTVFETFVMMVLQQRVSWREAARSFRQLVLRFGEPAPDHPDLFVAPPPAVWKTLPLETYRAFEVDGQRARTLKAGAGSVRRLEEIRTLPLDDAYGRLRAFPGVGVWTAQYVLGLALGFSDAVPLDDYDLPRLVGRALAGEDRADDARMLELLAPFSGHRFRVIRMLMESGISTPRFGPRRPGSSFRRRDR